GTVSAPTNVILTNTGNTTLNVSSAVSSGANPQDFLVVNGCTAAVPVGGNCAVSVQFAPLAQGQRTAKLAVSDNAPGSPQSLDLTGTASGQPFVFPPASPSSL